MAGVALASLISTIKLEFLQPFPRVPLHDHHQPLIQSLFERICSLQVFLQESSGSGNGGAAIRFLEIKIRDFALKAEDDIETQLCNFLILAKDKDKEEGDEHPEKASHHHQELLHETLRKAAENAAQLLSIIQSTFDNVEAASDETKPVDFESQNNEVEEELLDGSLWPENKMVGRGDDYEIIMYQLVDKMVGSDDAERTIQRIIQQMKDINRKINETMIRQQIEDRTVLKLICIVGMPGIGKTTLAQSFYKDPKIEEYFDRRAWITLPKKYNRREILCNLFLSLMVAAEEEAISDEIIKRGTDEDVEESLYRLLKGWRFLIVLDNWWNSEAWDDIRQCFPNDNCGSRILLTTTHFDRHSYAATSSNNYYVHYMTLLDSTHSWDIFFNNLSRKGHLAPKFENIRSHEIVEKCDGLPQLIVTVAKRLSKCDDIQREGKRIEKELDSVGIYDRSALTFVYNQLPHHLKVCFLYLAVFPKRSETLVKMLIGLWVAEGFANSEYEAYSYLLELLDRSLVLISNQSSNGEIKNCRIHSTLHSFCAGETQRGGILCAVNTQQHLGLPLSEFANSCRWLSLSKHSFDYYVLSSTNTCRSMFFFCENSELFVPLKFSRVLALVPSLFLESENFMFLRYLHVKQWFEGLDEIVSTNPNLKVLIVSHKGGTSSSFQNEMMPLGSKIWETARVIRHVEVSYSLSVDPPREVKESLQSLYWLSLDHCTMELFLRIPNVKKLGIICGCKPSPIAIEPANLCNLGSLDKLETLMIAFRKGSPTGLRNLESLPLYLNIKKLKLKRTCLQWSDINVIGMLPNLEVLKLKEVSDDSDWTPTQGNFSKLKFLYVEAKNLVYWDIDGGDQFLCLEHLVLKRCTQLEALPTGFEDIYTLESIELINCSSPVKESAQEISDNRENYYGMQPIVIRHVDRIQEAEDVEDAEDVADSSE